MIERQTYPWPGHSPSRPPAVPLRGGVRRTPRPGRQVRPQALGLGPCHNAFYANPQEQVRLFPGLRVKGIMPTGRFATSAGIASRLASGRPPPPTQRDFLSISFRLASSQGESPTPRSHQVKRGGLGAAAERRSHSDHCTALVFVVARACLICSRASVHPCARPRSREARERGMFSRGTTRRRRPYPRLKHRPNNVGPYVEPAGLHNVLYAKVWKNRTPQSGVCVKPVM
jgi:hypothetical protein